MCSNCVGKALNVVCSSPEPSYVAYTIKYKNGFACLWLGNVDMHMYEKCDQNIACGSNEHFH